MNSLEYETVKRYCIRKKHVAIICAVVVVVGLIVGLSVGLTRTCDTSEDSGQTPTIPGSPAPGTPGPSALPSPEDSPCPANADESGQWTNFRLPTYINPVHYDLEVKPLMEEDTYTGTVTIHINVTQPTKHLWLHLRETWITKPSPVLKKSSGEEIPLKKCFEYKKQEYVVIEAEEELPPTDGESTYHLTMNFQGWLNGSLVGFYRTTYTENGITKSIAATDHEPTDARKTFPCFDEPNKKATYTISIVHPKEYDALSNMPSQRTEVLDDKWIRTVFNKSVPMSTYLVCFAVHQFDYVEKISAKGIPLRIYVQPLQKHTAEYASNITKIVFDYFEEYFAMDYALPKLDKIAIPDFGTGAMENWGLITYRETNLLYDPEESASSNKQRVAAVVAHELVHQWFGNIVTMDWWEDLWLNEGFASFFEFLGVNEAEKNWQMRYLEKYKFKNAKTDDFWEALEQASGKPVKEVMDTWTRQMGYPVLSVQANHLLKQSRFLLDPKADPSQPPSALGYTWNIPVRWAEGNEMNITFYNMTEKEVLEANLLNYRFPLNLTLYLKNENDYLAWQRVISALSYMTSMLEDDRELYPMLKEYLQGRVKPVADALGWKDEGEHLEKLLRASVLGLACKMGDPEALNNASDLFNKWQNGERQPVNLRLLVYRYGMQFSGNETSWNYTLQKYQDTTLAQEKEKLLYGLASVNNITLLSRFLWLFINSPKGIFTLNDRNLGRIVTIAEPFNTEFQLWQIEMFFKKYPEAGAGAASRQKVLETVKNNIEWLKLHREEIKEWLLYAISRND
ncbi:glutamyl aminopeptidase [Gracilinanus agilis]|uniref:glutamyl aminopeptidase n=1 Tax=Gracilinanus agilis TaxID=191870 RepID=UPI001CFD5924|nr:glutamyl aminopeptidase [Gracilinanus agilis]